MTNPSIPWYPAVWGWICALLMTVAANVGLEAAEVPAAAFSVKGSACWEFPDTDFKD